MVKTEECKWSRAKRVYVAQGVTCFLGICCLAFGIVCIIFQARAHICNTSGPGGVHVGRYPSAPNAFQPRNCIPECEAQCAAQYMEGPAALRSCRRCLDYCTHPWGKHIEECAGAPECDFEHVTGIIHYCQGMAYCFSGCAKECIDVCRDDGYIAVWSGITSLICGLGAWVLIPIIAGFGNLVWIGVALFSFLPWLTALILSVDTFNLNLNGRGWSFLWDEAQKYNITPNYMVGMILIFILFALCLMLFSFWDPKEVWYRNQHNVKQEQFLQKQTEARAEAEAKQRAADEAYEQSIADAKRAEREGEEQRERDRLAYLAASVAPPVEGDRPDPTGTTAAPFVEASEPPPGVSGALTVPKQETAEAPAPPPQNVTVGLSFAYNDDGEVVVDSVTAGGPAAKTGLIQKGDVVCEVGDSDPNGQPMKEVYKQPIENWAPIVKGGAAGTSVRFILARHAEQKRFIADIVREPAA